MTIFAETVLIVRDPDASRNALTPFAPVEKQVRLLGEWIAPLPNTTKAMIVFERDFDYRIVDFIEVDTADIVAQTFAQN